MKELAHEEYIDDDFQMDWLSPKRLAELREERKRNPPSQEELDKVQAFWNKLMEGCAGKSPGNKRSPLYIRSAGCS